LRCYQAYKKLASIDNISKNEVERLASKSKERVCEENDMNTPLS